MRSLLGVCLVSFFLLEVLQSSALDSKCYFGLGLESGRIADDQITASINTSSPTSGRLNHGHGAWCFKSSDTIDEVFFSVDLGEVQLISGFQSQGPPQSKHGVEYLRYVGLRVALSLDGSTWRDCCGDLFYADDKSDSQDVITTHSFHRVETARYIRILASSGVRWVGHEEKCFRFEVLGCSLNDLSQGFQPEIHLMFNALPAGFLDIQWTRPEVEVANRERVVLESERFLANLIFEEGEKPDITQFNLTTPGFISPNPLFGAKYQVDITCVYQGFAINCGNYEKEATLKAPSSCFLHVSPCSISDRIDFIRPHRFRAISLEDGSVMVRWTETRNGWRSPKMRLKVEDDTGNVIEELGDSIQKVITLPNLQKTNDYKLIFTPYGPNIPTKVKEHSGTLILMLKLNSTKHHSFVTDVDFTSQIQWSGQIRSTWEPARAVMEDKKANVYSEMEALGYIISLRPMGGSGDEILQTANLSYADNSYSFGGILMGNSYQLSLDCVFQNQLIPCGNTVIASGSPVHFVESNSSMTLYVETSLPDQWEDLESECISSGGHLVSLDHYYLEEALARNTNLSSYWSGGNICSNSPAPPDSMWSDGSAELSTNFAFNSGLDGGHCCIKVDIVHQPRLNSSSVWKGENCATYLHGICEYQVTDYLDQPMNLVGTALSPESINLTWSGAMKFWQPQEFMVVYCHVRHLSVASLPIRGNFCRYDTVKDQSLIIEGLEPFSEYNISIIGKLPPFEKTAPALGSARTLPMSDVEWIITPKGHLIVSWLKKIAKFEEADVVMLSLKNLDGDISSNYTGTAAEVRVSNLQLGGMYEVFLYDPKYEATFGPIAIEAYPNCSSGTRIGFSCSYYGSDPASEARADSICQEDFFEAQARLSEPAKALNVTSDLVWMGTDVRNRTPRFDTSIMQEEGAEKEAKIRFPDTNYTSEADSCSAWSISQERLRETPCDEILPVLCQNEIPLQSNAPNRSSLKIIPGPTHVVLSWDAESDQGWETNYTVRVTPKTEVFDPMDPLGYNGNDTLNRTGRLENDSLLPFEFHVLSSSAPPINLTNLLPESEYTVELITSLGPKFKTTLQLDNVYTTANNSKMPAEIVGYTMVPDDYRTAEFSIMSFVMIILLLCIIILLISGTIPVYSDNAMQVCFQISLFLFTLSLLLAGTDGPWSWDLEDQTWCAVAVGCLAFFILTALTFLLLESLCIAHKLVSWVTCPLLDNISIMVAMGFLFPLIYVVIVVPIFHNNLVPDQQRVCWLNLSNNASAAILVPISLLFLGTLIILLISLFSGSKERLMSASYHIRSSTLRYTRYVLMLILGLLGLVIGLGLSATHLDSPGFLVTFMVFHLILALVILILRCLLDKQFLPTGLGV